MIVIPEKLGLIKNKEFPILDEEIEQYLALLGTGFNNYRRC
ncbi:hypothetical protein [Bacillus sp. SA1-12]|nr:hypothetical protein [Bacillus sp. SA1-12]